MFRLLHALTQLLQIWWTKDRIRVARSEGKLFRIRVGDRLLIEDKIFHVLTRQESQSSAIVTVVYTLEEEQADSNQVCSLSCTMQSENSLLECRSDSLGIFNEHIASIFNERITILAQSKNRLNYFTS